MNPHNLARQLNRRQIIQFLDMSGIGYLLGSCSTMVRQSVSRHQLN